MNSETTQSIAKTILNQIKCGDRWALMAWGATGFSSIGESKEFQGGISFRVNGIIHRGWISVKLKWIDTYTIIFTNKYGIEVKRMDDVYCDELVKAIDYIEGK